MKLTQADLDFILFQLNLPGNDPRNGAVPFGTILDPTGIRDVQGIGNNVLHPTWGAADQLFPRLTNPAWLNAQGTFTMGQRGVEITLNPAVSYQTRDINLVDSSPRIISNFVANQSPEALSAIGYVTPGEQAHAIIDDPDATPNGRLSPLTGDVNPLPYSSYMTLFGQFFDHGLDLVQKGLDGAVLVPLLPGDPLYNHPDNMVAPGVYNNFIIASRTNTTHVKIGVASSDALIAELGLSETPQSEAGATSAVTGSLALDNSIQAGVLIINNHAIDIAAGSSRQALLDAINAQSGATGVTASLDADNHLVLTPAAGESHNTISPFIDLSQSYGSSQHHTAFVREYDTSGGITGRLVSGDGGLAEKGMATWAGIKANAARIGIILHDKDVTDIPQVRLNADGSMFIDANGQGYLVARNVVTGAIQYVQDSNVGAGLVLQTIGHAFLDDMAHGILRTLDANGDVADPQASALLDAHFIAGDGRANENIGLTAIHDVFHSEHNLVLQNILAMLTPVDGNTINIGDGTSNSLSNALGLVEQNNAVQSLTGSTVITGIVPGGGANPRNLVINGTSIAIVANSTLDDVVAAINAVQGVTGVGALNSAGSLQLLANYYSDINGGVWTGERLFQAAKLVTEMEYQHLVFGEFTRKFSPNINLFAGYDVTIDPAIAAEFAHAVYRFGHSMLTETVGLQKFNNQGLAIADATVSTTAMVVSTTAASDKVTVTLREHGLVTGNYIKIAGVADAIGGLAAANLNGEFKVRVVNADTLEITAASAATSAATGLGGDTITISLNHDLGLIEAFLNPQAYTDTTAGEVAIGMSSQVGNAIDEWVTDALRNNLVGLPLDLATLNIVRGRDTGLPSLNGVREQLFAQTGMTELKPYANWDEFGMNLLHHESLENFIMAYSRDAIIEGFGAGTTAAATTDLGTWDALQGSDPAAYASALREAARLAIDDPAFMTQDRGVDTVDFWLGGLAEAKVIGGMLGSTFDFIFAAQMIKLQNADRFYYLARLPGTDLLLEIEAQLFADIVMRNTGVKHLYPDIFTVPDTQIELSDPSLRSFGTTSAMGNNANRIAAVDIFGANVWISTAGWVGTDPDTRVFHGNPGDYLDARGALSPNGRGNASELIGGTEGVDRINAGGGNDAVWGDGGNDVIEGGRGNDFIHGGEGNDWITDVEGDDLIWGDGGDDTIHAGGGLDQVFGGTGNDIIYGGLGDDAIDGGPGDDIIYGDNGAIDMSNGIAVMDPTGGADVIDGGDGDDIIYGGGGDDLIDGGPGNDTIYGGPGNDTVVGLEGDDRFIMDPSDLGFNNVLDGGLGFDWVDYSASLGNGIGTGANRQGVVINLSNVGPVAVPVVPGTVQASDSFLSVEGAIGSAFNDHMTGGALIVNVYVPDPVTGLPTNVLDVAASAAASIGFQTDALGLPVVITVNGVQTLVAIDFHLIGGAGNDVLTGGDGHDTLDGGIGTDLMVGGLGDDIYVVNAAADVVTELVAQGTDTIQTTLGSFSLNNRANIENLTYIGDGNFIGSGNALANVITGGVGNDTLTGGGNDRLVGLGGDDIYVVSAGDVVVEALDGGTDTVRTTAGTFSLANMANVENLTYTGNGNFTGTGNALDNVITSGSGNDTLNGGAGADTLIGGAGNDTYIVDDAGDLIIENVNAGTDTVRTAFSSFSLADNLENLTYTGNQSFTGIGNDLDNVITGGIAADVLSGGAGNDRLVGGAGADMMIGGAGDDTYVVDNVRDMIFELLGDGVDTVETTLASMTLAANVENLTKTGGGRFTGNGNSLDNVITGSTGIDRLSGLDGSDTLIGGAGNDILTGGNGADRLTGGTGADTFVFTQVAQSNAVDGFDTITDFTRGLDKISLVGIDAHTALPNSQRFSSLIQGNVNFTDGGQLRYYTRSVGGQTVTTIEGNTDTDFATAELRIDLLGIYNTLSLSTVTANSDFIV